MEERDWFHDVNVKKGAVGNIKSGLVTITNGIPATADTSKVCMY